MKRATVAAATILLALAGCQDDQHFPPGEGSGPGGSGGGGAGNRIDGGARIDSGATDGSTGFDAGIAGELCDVVDVRNPVACTVRAPSGIEVSVVGSSASALTDAMGEFELVGSEPGAILKIAGDQTRTARVPADMWQGGSVRAPRVTQARWDALIGDIDGTEPDGTASIALYIIRTGSGEPVAGASVAVAGVDQVFYDDASVVGWTPGGATGTSGAVLLLSVPAELGQVSVTGAVGGGADFEGSVPVEAGVLTWARIEIP